LAKNVIAAKDVDTVECEGNANTQSAYEASSERKHFCYFSFLRRAGELHVISLRRRIEYKGKIPSIYKNISVLN
jgi:hypothetical protein